VGCHVVEHGGEHAEREYDVDETEHEKLPPTRVVDEANADDRVLMVLKPNRIIHKRTNANCSSFHLRVFQGLSNPYGKRQTSTLSIPRDNFGERKAKFNLRMSRITQMHTCTLDFRTILKDRRRPPDQLIAQ
jgi:hypothetical protein